MLNFIVCDDNDILRDKLTRMLENIFTRHSCLCNILLSTGDPNKVLKYSQRYKSCVYILDIDLKSEMSGVDLAHKLREDDKEAYFIFSTAHTEYIMVAYKAKTFDYLVKPITYERMEECILRLLEDISAENQKYINFGNKVILNANDIVYIEKCNNRVNVYTENESILIYNTLDKLSNFLPRNFVRCHKSYIINKDKISSIDMTRNIVTFSDNKICTIGPKYKNELMEVMKNDLSTIICT